MKRIARIISRIAQPPCHPSPMAMAHGRRQQGGPSWIFIHGTDKVDRGFIALFFGLDCYFSVFFIVALLLPLEEA